MPAMHSNSYDEILLLLSPAAAKLSRSRLERWSRVLEEGFGSPVVRLHGDQPAFRKKVEESQEARRLVLAAGGDGTLNLAVNWVKKLGLFNVVLGALPLGTGKDWAKSAGVPLDPDACVAWLAAQKPLFCDLGVAEWRRNHETSRSCFVNVTSLGISADVDLYVKEAKVRHPFLYLVAALRAILGSSPPEVKVYLDGQSWFQGKTWLLAIGNGRYFGGGMAVTPNAFLDDGLLDVILVPQVSRLNLLASFYQIYLGSHIRRKDVLSGQASEISIDCEEGLMGVDLDGDATLADQLQVRTEHRGIEVLASPEGPGFKRQKRGGV